MKRTKDVDPLTAAMRPSSDETPEERAQREAQERMAKQVSDSIDADIESERKKQKYDNTVRVLLLGQSESGKSTTLKQFQLIFAAPQFQLERISWKYVVQLNLVRSIRIILEQLSSLTTTRPIPFEDNKPARTVHPLSPFGAFPRANGSTSSLAISSNSSGMSSDSDLPSTTASVNTPSRLSHSNPFGNSSPITPVTRSPTTPFPSSPAPPVPVTPLPTPLEMPKLGDAHRTLRMRLLPILHLEKSLLKRLDPSGEDFEATQLGTNWITSGKELFVRSTSNWKEKLARMRTGNPDSPSNEHSHEDFDDPEDPENVIHACRHDMLTLWHDPVVRQVLHIGGVRLEEMPGFFLDDIERITEIGYVPSDDDVLKARLKTVGVSEYSYSVAMMGEKTQWTFYDVGGTRTQRAAWQPYFSHVDALIFLAPISAFDQALVEDRRVNRLEDSLLLFKAICKSVLLKEVNVVLFLNKVDILRSKLESGVKVNKYVKSYGDRSNDYETVSKFFRSKFVSIHKEYTPKETRRMFYVHMTTVTETSAMRSILSSVCDAIFRANLHHTHLA